MIIFLLTVVLWLVSKPLGDWMGIKIPTSLPAVLGACLFFLPGVTDIRWKDVESDISWSGILLIASGISLGMLVYQSGAAQWLAMLLLGNIGALPVLVQIISVILIVSILKLGLSSNTVTATVVIPIMIAVASQLGLSPLGIVMPAAMTLNIAFILVTTRQPA
jgi:sodium-dependent dicarboxylate transporter 2/3/5